jgi:stage V sporulation protein B
MSILFASIVGFGAAGLFITFSYDLGMLIYNQNLSAILIPFGLMAPFMYMQVILAGLLNGLGHQVFIFRNSLLSSVINIGFIYFLVPKFGISMFIIGWFISLIIVCALELHKLRKSININLEFVNWFVKPFIAGVCASVGCMTVRHTVLNGNVSLTATVGLITFFGFVYFLLIIMTGAMAWRDIKRLFKAA